MTSWNGPDRAGFEPDLLVFFVLADETTALVMVCLRLIAASSPHMVVSGNLRWDVGHRPSSYKLKHQH